MKKFLSLFLVLVVLMALVGTAAADDFKIGVILVHDEQSGYDQAHIEGLLGTYDKEGNLIRNGALQNLGLSKDQIIFKYNVPETDLVKDAARDLVDLGCNLIISDSYGHQGFMMEVAEEFPDVHFIAATGDMAANEDLDNVSNMFPYTFESRYVSGVVAGMKLKELMDAGTVTDPHVGYVGAFPYAEVVSGYTAFFLGIRSIVPDAYMEVQYTNNWYDPNEERDAANALIARGCVIIGQHADSTGAPIAVENAYKNGKVAYSVGYNVSMLEVAEDVALTSAQNCWSELYTPMIKMAMEGEELPKDYAVGYAHDAVQISELGKSCAEGTQEAVDAAIAGIKDGTLNIFDTANFTIGGETLTSEFAEAYGAAHPKMWPYDKAPEAIIDGVLYESYSEEGFRSAPYFIYRIDGITELNADPDL